MVLGQVPFPFAMPLQMVCRERVHNMARGTGTHGALRPGMLCIP